MVKREEWFEEEVSKHRALPIFDFPSSYFVRCRTWWTILLLVEFEKNVCLLLMVKLRGQQQNAPLVIHHVTLHQYHPVKVLSDSRVNNDGEFIKAEFMGWSVLSFEHP